MLLYLWGLFSVLWLPEAGLCLKDTSSQKQHSPLSSNLMSIWYCPYSWLGLPSCVLVFVMPRIHWSICHQPVSEATSQPGAPPCCSNDQCTQALFPFVGDLSMWHISPIFPLIFLFSFFTKLCLKMIHKHPWAFCSNPLLNSSHGHGQALTLSPSHYKPTHAQAWTSKPHNSE